MQMMVCLGCAGWTLAGWAGGCVGPDSTPNPPPNPPPNPTPNPAPNPRANSSFHSVPNHAPNSMLERIAFVGQALHMQAALHKNPPPKSKSPAK